MTEFPKIYPCVVLGNGPSRQDLPITDLHADVKVYGCNAIYRDYKWLAAYGVVDNEMHAEMRAACPAERLVFRFNNDDGAIACGPMMLDYAASQRTRRTPGHHPVFMVGFDFTRQTLYAGTRNYKPPITDEKVAAERPPEWVQQVDNVLARHHRTTFMQVVDEGAVGLYRTCTWATMIASVRAYISMGEGK